MSATTQSVRPASPLPAEGAKQSGGIAARILPLVLIVIYAAQCAQFIGTQSFTIDEPFNIVAGLAHWHGEGSLADDNPPGARLLCSVLLLGSRSGGIVAANPKFEPGHSLDPYDVAWRTRSMNVLLGIALGMALWAAARRHFSLGAANFALALYAFSPPVIAHFSLVGTDGIAALMLFVTAVQVARFRRHPSWTQALLSGAALGGLLLAKLYTLPMCALALLLMVIPSPVPSDLRQGHWGKTAAALCISFLLLWAGYGFDLSRFVVRGNMAWIERHGVSVTDPIPLVLQHDFSVRLPAPDFLYSIIYQLEHGLEGHPSYLLGKTSVHGWHAYFPIAIALKWPTVVLLLALLAAVLIATGRLRVSAEQPTVAIFPAAFLLLAILSTVNIGDRYVLAVFPFVLLLAAGLWEWAGRRRALLAALVLAAALNAADALRYSPDYLSYFAVFIPAEQSWRYLSDSSLDWGQSLIALRDYQQRHPGEVLHLALWGTTVAPELYGIHAVDFGESQRPSGTVILGPGALSGQFNRDPQAYHWVLQYPRETVLNHTLQVFHVP